MKKTILIILAILIVGVIIGGGYYLLQQKKSPEQKNISSQQESVSPNPKQEVYVPEQSSQEVSVKTIDIHTGLTQSQLVPPGQQYPAYLFKHTNGHYMIWLDSANDGKGMLMYDGQQVSSQSLTKMYNSGIAPIGISRNGQHYIYAVRNDSSDDLYIDGKKVATDVVIKDPTVTDDGQHYFYISQANRPDNNLGSTLLKKDGVQIYSHDQGILSYQISSDGQHYLAQLRNTNPSNGYFVDSLIVDGKEILKERNMRDGEWALSNNGLHYGFIMSGPSDGNGYSTGNEELYIDGKKILDSKTLYGLKITDSGAYAVSAPEDKVFYTSLGTVPMQDPQNGAFIYINEAMSHYFAEGKLDGNAINLPKGEIDLAENDIFVYNLTK